ncbi:hypothetical protein ACHAWF_018620 [Thalassiosira exigua]
MEIRKSDANQARRTARPVHHIAVTMAMTPSRQSTTRTTISSSTARLVLLLSTAFLFGIAVCSAFFLWQTHRTDPLLSTSHLPHYHGNVPLSPAKGRLSTSKKKAGDGSDSASSSSILEGLRVLVTIASYDFMQIAHLEEVLDGFRDLCYAGSMVDIVVYTTVMYPVALIDMFNDRMRCNNPSPSSGLTVTLILKPSSVRLFLVDFHRELFYDRIDQYDLFVYTEDDIRISPTTLAAYLYETKRVESLVGPEQALDFNVGIVRYEYDFPQNVVITDKTRHASVNVTRVYWEHVGHPAFEKSVNKVKDKQLSPYYVSMKGPHQGMYMVTPNRLRAWKDRPKCRFDEIRERPSHPDRPHQPSEGTQRVWMSSHMMYGKGHCKITQLLPVENFGQLTVLHLPNKNYRRVGKQGRLGGGDVHAPKNSFKDGTEYFEPTHPDLLKALELHIALKREFTKLQSNIGGEKKVYTGIRMVDTGVEYRKMHKNHRAAARKRMEAYSAYVERGGYMIDEDMDIDVDEWRENSSI